MCTSRPRTSCRSFGSGSQLVCVRKNNDVLIFFNLKQPEPIFIVIMPPPLIGGGIKRCFCLTSNVCLTSVCLSVCLSRTSGLSREQRPRRTKTGTEVAHVTCNSDTTFKVKRSKVNLQRAWAYSGGLPHKLVYNSLLHVRNNNFFLNPIT